MNKKLFWLGYLLAIVAVAWILWRQRREEVEMALERLRQATPGESDWPRRERAAPVSEKAESEAPLSPAPERLPPAPNVTNSDNLQQISGVGPAFARRMREAGITTFQQLATLPADEIRQRMALQPWQGDVESWKEQARSLSSS